MSTENMQESIRILDFPDLFRKWKKIKKRTAKEIAKDYGVRLSALNRAAWGKSSIILKGEVLAMVFDMHDDLKEAGEL